MFDIPPILAAVNWIQILIFILFFLIPLLTQFKGGNDEAKQPKRDQPRRRPQPPRQGDPPPQVGGGRAALEAEIEDFMRRSGKARQPQKPVEKPAAEPAEVRRLVPKRDQAEPLREAMRDQVIVAKAADAPPPAEMGGGVSQHVQQHIEAHPVTEHSGQLGSSIGQADERLESHLHQVFDHGLGKITPDKEGRGPAEGTDSAVWETAESRRERQQQQFDLRSAGVAAMLRDPTNIQQAVILSEILRRPEDWD